MKRTQNTPRTKTAGFAVLPSTLKMLDILMQTGNYVSSSEIVRSAVKLFFDQNSPKEKPAYVEEIERRKQKDIEKIRIAKMTPEEYIAEEFAGLVDGYYKDFPDGRYYMIRNPKGGAEHGFSLNIIKEKTREDIPEAFLIKKK